MRTILLAGGLAMALTLVGTRYFIDFLASRGYGQFVRDDGPTTHHAKRGTPTMGGLIVLLSAIASYFISHLITRTPVTISAMLILGLAAAMGAVGFVDDWTKISRQRSLGLSARWKLILQTGIGVAFAIGALQFPNERGITPASTSISFLRDIPWLTLPAVVIVIWIVLLIAAASNGVNLTDGLDGLATGSVTMVFGAYTIISIWQYNQWCARASSLGPTCYDVRNPYDLAVVALAFAGACFGFLWWNAKPAKIIMGDTGALSFGAAIAGLAVFTRTELLLAVVGLLFVLETLSVIIQVGYFKATKGKRFFKMAPVHHHFELLGWEEVTVVIRFWIISALGVVGAIGIFYAEWVARS